MRTPRALAVLSSVAVALAASGVSPSAQASDGWVSRDYFGVNFQQLRVMKPSDRAKHLAKIAKLGIRDVRLGIAWPRVEPVPPVGGVHDYRWDAIDAEVGTMARHGIRAQANITQTPRWNAPTGIINNLGCSNTSSWAPKDITPYIDLTGAIAARYGRNGTFWRQNPDLPAKPIVRYEIWNEPNLRGGWCPKPQPDLYADMFVGAARAIHSVDRRAQVVTGGIAPPAKVNQSYLTISDFLGRATAHQPGLVHMASGVAVHVYPPAARGKQLERVAWFRKQLHDGSIPDRTPMLINEIGWATQGGSSAVPEDERAAAYKDAAENLPRTNCNVMGMLPQTWTSDQTNPDDPEDWFGIAGPVTARPYPSAHAYANAAQLMRGELNKPPPSDPLMVCPGMPPPKPPGGGSTRACTILGTGGVDHLVGTRERDVICGLRGRDTIKAKGGRDVIRGAGGRDRILGGKGRDRIGGGRGRDKLSGGSGNDLIRGGAGDDVLRGGPGRDRLKGGAGNDRKIQ